LWEKEKAYSGERVDTRKEEDRELREKRRKNQKTHHIISPK